MKKYFVTFYHEAYLKKRSVIIEAGSFGGAEFIFNNGPYKGNKIRSITLIEDKK